MEKNIRNLLVNELLDILSGENQLVKILPKMTAAAQSAELKEAFKHHLKETKNQVIRLKKIFKIMKISAKPKFCKGIRGLIQEAEEAIRDYKKSSLRDAAIITKAQRIEHYEIAAYGAVRTFAKELELDIIADLLQETLDEEGQTDKKLSKIAEGGLFKEGINTQAHFPIEETFIRKAPSPRRRKSPTVRT